MRTPVQQLVAQAAHHRQAGRWPEAIAAMHRACGLQPGNAATAHDLGLFCLEAGRVEDAISALRRAVSLKPDFALAFLRLGVALERRSNFTEAVRMYRKAVALLPSLAEAHFRLAAQLEDMGDRPGAIEAFNRAKAQAPKGSLRDMAEARGLVAQNRDREAERVLRRALRNHGDSPSIQHFLGAVLSSLGRFEEAAICYEHALDRMPGLVAAYYELVRCRTVTPENRALLDRMEAALGQAGIDDLPLTKLHLAIGKAHDDLGEYDQAMVAFDAADRARRRVEKFDPEAFDAQIDDLISAFTPEVLASAAALGNLDRTPVLIVGMPRSGTTLCEQIISSHPEASGGGELYFWRPRGELWKTLGQASPPPSFIDEAAAACIDLLRAISPAAKRVTDKNPFNFLWAGLVHLVFPRATIIHCRRSPIDTALSIHQTFFAPGLKFPTGGEDLVAYYRGYEKLMAHWRRVLPADRFLEVDYETLTAEPEATIRNMIGFIGLEWSEACLRPEENDRVVKTPSKWQVKRPIHRGAVERWRAYEPFLGPLAALAPQPDEQRRRS